MDHLPMSDSLTSPTGHFKTIDSLMKADLPSVDPFTLVTSKWHPLGSHHICHQRSPWSMGKLSKSWNSNIRWRVQILPVDTHHVVIFPGLTGSLCSLGRKCLPKSRSEDHGLSLSGSVKQRWCPGKTCCLCTSDFLDMRSHPGQPRRVLQGIPLLPQDIREAHPQTEMG